MTEREEILDRIRQASRRFPDRMAYEDGKCRISYKELWSRAQRCGQFLGKGRGPVILYGHMQTGIAVGILSCLMAGRAYVPVDCFMPDARLRTIADASQASLLLQMGEKHVPELPGVRILTEKQLEAAASMGETAAPPCEVATFPREGGAQPNEADAFPRVSSAPRETDPLPREMSPPPRESAPQLSAHANETAYIIFTSGSTGDPKGVPVSYRNLESFIRWVTAQPALDVCPQQRVLQQASFSFDLSVADFFYALSLGHTVAAFDGDVMADFGRLAQLLESIDMTVTTPAFLKLCLVNPDFCAQKYPRLARAYCCGERLEASVALRLLNAFPDLVLLNAYGPTEAASAVCAAVITRQMAENAAKAGKSLPVGELGSAATEITVENGEIVLKGSSVSDGYLGGVTGGFYRENGRNCYRTGDLGYIRDGLLYCEGRRDDQIKYKGYRIELHDIESNLARVKGVRDCVVLARRGRDGLVKGLRAFVAAEEGTTEAELKQELGRYVPAYMVPGTFVMMKALPVTANGKTDRKALERYGA
ncbi:MAG: AMP-binding protein [Lachnospiraceae bacterium]|nr:AMP-binding protein [Lachnospiraceae bacterium]